MAARLPTPEPRRRRITRSGAESGVATERHGHVGSVQPQVRAPSASLPKSGRVVGVSVRSGGRPVPRSAAAGGGGGPSLAGRRPAERAGVRARTARLLLPAVLWKGEPATRRRAARGSGAPGVVLFASGGGSPGASKRTCPVGCVLEVSVPYGPAFADPVPFARSRRCPAVVPSCRRAVARAGRSSASSARHHPRAVAGRRPRACPAPPRCPRPGPSVRHHHRRRPTPPRADRPGRPRRPVPCRGPLPAAALPVSCAVGLSVRRPIVRAVATSGVRLSRKQALSWGYSCARSCGWWA